MAGQGGEVAIGVVIEGAGMLGGVFEPSPPTPRAERGGPEPGVLVVAVLVTNLIEGIAEVMALLERDGGRDAVELVLRRRVGGILCPERRAGPAELPAVLREVHAEDVGRQPLVKPPSSAIVSGILSGTESWSVDPDEGPVEVVGEVHTLDPIVAQFSALDRPTATVVFRGGVAVPNAAISRAVRSDDALVLVVFVAQVKFIGAAPVVHSLEHHAGRGVEFVFEQDRSEALDVLVDGGNVALGVVSIGDGVAPVVGHAGESVRQVELITEGGDGGPVEGEDALRATGAVRIGGRVVHGPVDIVHMKRERVVRIEDVDAAADGPRTGVVADVPVLAVDHILSGLGEARPFQTVVPGGHHPTIRGVLAEEVAEAVVGVLRHVGVVRGAGARVGIVDIDPLGRNCADKPARRIVVVKRVVVVVERVGQGEVIIERTDRAVGRLDLVHAVLEDPIALVFDAAEEVNGQLLLTRLGTGRIGFRLEQVVAHPQGVAVPCGTVDDVHVIDADLEAVGVEVLLGIQMQPPPIDPRGVEDLHELVRRHRVGFREGFGIERLPNERAAQGLNRGQPGFLDPLPIGDDPGVGRRIEGLAVGRVATLRAPWSRGDDGEEMVHGQPLLEPKGQFDAVFLTRDELEGIRAIQIERVDAVSVDGGGRLVRVA